MQNFNITVSFTVLIHDVNFLTLCPLEGDVFYKLLARGEALFRNAAFIRGRRYLEMQRLLEMRRLSEGRVYQRVAVIRGLCFFRRNIVSIT